MLRRVIRHIVWDWNGTLFDDQHLVLRSTNASLRAVGVKRETTYDEYRALYQRPLQAFYQALADRPLTAADQPLLSEGFASYYSAHFLEFGLNAEASAALGAWAPPRTQSMLSMFDHDPLVALVTRHGISDRFTRIDGRPPITDLGSKLKYFKRHLEQLIAADPALTADQVAVIGDCLDDAESAVAHGAHAVLFTGGTSNRAVLEVMGVPVVDSLMEAVALVSELG